MQTSASLYALFGAIYLHDQNPERIKVADKVEELQCYHTVTGRSRVAMGVAAVVSDFLISATRVQLLRWYDVTRNPG